MRVSCLYFINVLTLQKSEVMTVSDMYKLVELELGLSALLDLLRCTALLVSLGFGKVL